ncbi:hypothetical protein PsorP6_011457 [Peronosclerospora sorghi]|uniref:Uncharacterized protein n=1 Tax=Peronosclerospora sorghi TaxID=230839 RepID=A0ACC0WJW0_9STRA|nr:hypothetical protein PsorP6_011457 [Peronosclerospora sorghi]
MRNRTSTYLISAFFYPYSNIFYYSLVHEIALRICKLQNVVGNLIPAELNGSNLSTKRIRLGHFIEIQQCDTPVKFNSSNKHRFE